MHHDVMANLDRWRVLMNLWGLHNNQTTFDALLASYTEKGRHYHGLAHISACLRHLDGCASQLEEPRKVELALWFHDAIYQPLQGGNERKSADWAMAFLRENGASQAQIDRVERLIMVTEHNAPTQSRDESLLVDIDLAILGAEPAVYDQFERDIRSEYQLVPLFIYRRKRAALLRGFLERPQLFHNAPFLDREQQARANLSRAIADLTG